MKKNFVIGCGFFAKQCIDILIRNKVHIHGYFDDFNTTNYRNIKFFGIINDIKNKCDPESTNLFIGMGDNIIREKIYNKYNNYNFPNLIDNKSYVTEDCIMGIGNIFLANSFIQSESKIGNFNIIDMQSIIGHGSNIGNYNHIACHVCIGGPNNIGNHNKFFVNSFTLPKIEISDNIIIGANSFVNKSLLIPGKYVGIPVKKI